MAYRQLKDGRWQVYYWERQSDGSRKLIREYFGRGPEAEAAAKKRHEDLALRRTSPTQPKSGPNFAELAKAYLKASSMNATSRTNAKIRLEVNILPIIGHRSSPGYPP